MNGAPRKIVYVIGTLEIGGTEGHLLEVTRRLDRRRFAPQVWCLSRGGPLEEEFARAGVPVKILRFKGLLGKYDPFSLARLAGAFVHFVFELRRERPQVVHAYLFWAYVIGGLAAWWARVPVFIASRRQLGLFKDGNPHYQAMENLVNRVTDLVLVNSEAVRQDVLRRERISPRRVRVIYNGVEVSRFRASGDGRAIREELGIPPEAPVVGVIANLHPYKGHRDFLPAAARVSLRFPGAFFLLVGRDEGLQGELERLAVDLGLEGRAIFAGTRRDISEILAAINVIVLPSYQEGFSNVILEGMAAGKPLVVTDVGGNAEAVVHGETGLVVPPGDLGAMAEAIVTLLGDRELSRRMGEAGRRRVAELFNVESMVSQMEDLYKELLLRRCG